MNLPKGVRRALVLGVLVVLDHFDAWHRDDHLGVALKPQVGLLDFLQRDRLVRLSMPRCELSLCFAAICLEPWPSASASSRRSRWRASWGPSRPGLSPAAARRAFACSAYGRASDTSARLIPPGRDRGLPGVHSAQVMIVSSMKETLHSTI